MRPLFAIAPLALLLAIAGPRPERWDGREQARLDAERTAGTRTAPAPELRPASERPDAERPAAGLTAAERTAAQRPEAERTPTATRTSARGHTGLGLNTLTAEGPSPQGRPR